MIASRRCDSMRLKPAYWLAALLAGAIKLAWRREAKTLRWLRLWGWGAAGGAAAVVISVVLLGRDGKLIASFGTREEPTSEKIVRQIESAL